MRTRLVIPFAILVMGIEDVLLANMEVEAFISANFLNNSCLTSSFSTAGYS